MPKLRHRPTGGPPLEALLRAERFRLGPRTARVAQNLARFGAEDASRIDDRAAAWIGDDLPPHGAPSVTLGGARGTLGPHSFGFLDNHRGVAAYAGLLGERPRVGSIALVCGRRDELPDVAPLAAGRGLGVSWIISVGDGDATEVLAFLAADPSTSGLLLAARADAKAIAALGGKPLVLLGGDPLARASVRRAGGAAVDDLEVWLAHGALLEAGVARPSRPVAVVAGGGASVLADAARASGLALELLRVDDEDPEEAARAVAEASQGADLLLLAGDAAPPASPPSLRVDLGHAERVRALAAALAERGTPPEPPIPLAPADTPAARRIVDEAGPLLGDHDTKRVLKSYGVRVSRQAPANTATAAARLAQQLGYPVDVIARTGDETVVRRAASASELRRTAAVLLDGAPYVLLREPFPAAPRARLLVRRDRGFGLVAHVGGERALLPLERRDAIVLARAASGDDARALVELLARATRAAAELSLSLEAELWVGDEPAVVAASSRRA